MSDEDIARNEGQELETCPVCQEILLPPIYQCSAGHLFCECCVKKLSSCPAQNCHAFINSNNKIRNRYAEKLVIKRNVECKKCGVICGALAFKNHWYECAQITREYCRIFSLHCLHSFTTATVVEHLETVHGVRGIHLTELLPSSEIFQSIPTPLLERKTARWKPIYIYFEHKLFFLLTGFDAQVNCIWWKVCIAGSDVSGGNFLWSLRLVKQDAFLEWQRPTQSLFSHHSSMDSSFTIHLSTLRQFASEVRDDNRGTDGSVMSWKIGVTLFKKPPTPCSPEGMNEHISTEEEILVRDKYLAVDAVEEKTSKLFTILRHLWPF